MDLYSSVIKLASSTAKFWTKQKNFKLNKNILSLGIEKYLSTLDSPQTHLLKGASSIIYQPVSDLWICIARVHTDNSLVSNVN